MHAVSCRANGGYCLGRCDSGQKMVESTTKRPRVNILDFDLDSRHFSIEERPHPVGDLKEVQIGPSDTQRMKIGKALELEEEDQLVQTLRRNVDVFAWSAKDMSGIDLNFMCHRLSVSPNAKPMAQKKRKQGEEKRTAVREEVSKLVTADIVKKVQYPTWLANVVMVKKDNGRWRMCTDYTDLNKPA
ncbi:hypothetical protein CR513_17563, partial [Mucuna pruriens]